MMAKKKKNSDFDQYGNAFLQLMNDGYKITDICNQLGISYESIQQWRKEYPDYDYRYIEIEARRKDILIDKARRVLALSMEGGTYEEVTEEYMIQDGIEFLAKRIVNKKHQKPNVAAAIHITSKLDKEFQDSEKENDGVKEIKLILHDSNPNAGARDK